MNKWLQAWLNAVNAYINQQLWVQKRTNIWRTNGWRYFAKPMVEAINKFEWYKLDIYYSNDDWSYFIKIQDHWETEEYWFLNWEEFFNIIQYYADLTIYKK